MRERGRLSPTPRVEEEEPQDVAPSTETARPKGISDASPAAGATSCDSELAAIRLRAERRQVNGLEDRDALLRMVDELTRERDDVVRMLGEQEAVFSDERLAASKERDDLRAKLAEAEQRAANTVARADANEVRAQQLEALTVRYDDTCGEMSEYMIQLAFVQERVKELEAKLSEAKRIHQDMQLRHVERVKELEAKLAEAEKEASFLAERKNAHFKQAIANGKACQELEAKLTAAEGWRQEAADWKASSERNRERAEAAEARCREHLSAWARLNADFNSAVSTMEKAVRSEDLSWCANWLIVFKKVVDER